MALDGAIIAAGHIAERKLVPLFGVARCIKVQAHYAVYPARHATRPAVAALLGWLRQQAAASAA
ncbi:MAG: hypothetical protein JNJ60_09075 [Rhodocyclaceae bacterium]|nr:hypothetical protein [Rhodocyclaceae bacterium]